MLTVSARVLRLLLEDAEQRGVDTEDALGLAGVKRAQLEEPEARVPETTLRAVALHLLERVDDPAWGLSLSRNLQPGALGTLGYVFRNSETLQDSYERVVRYARLLSEAAEPRLEVGPTLTRFSLHSGDTVPLPRHAVRLRAQLWVSALVRVGRKITGVEFQPLRLAFPFPQPEDLEPYRALFSGELSFDAPTAAFEVASEVLRLPVINPDRNLASVMERYAAGLLEALPDHSDIGLRVRQATCRAVEDNDPRLERVARELAMSARSLQRKLQAERISFSEVLDEVRRELALAYLNEPDLSVDQVASVLGFASGSSFAKAFRRWTGSAPGSYRAGDARPA